MCVAISLSFFARTDQIGPFRSIVGGAPEAGIESAELAGVEPRAYLREATMRSVRNPGTVTLARDLKPSESRARRSGDRLSAANLARMGEDLLPSNKNCDVTLRTR